MGKPSPKLDATIAAMLKDITKFRPGQRFYSIGQSNIRYNVSSIVTTKALDYLVGMDLLIPVQRRGFFVKSPEVKRDAD